MHVSHEPWLVLLSYILALQGSYVGLHLARQVEAATGQRQRRLVAASALSFALAIWTMHFVGMLAMKMPFRLDFLVLPTLLSFLVCVLISGVAVFAACSKELTPRRLTLAAGLMGSGIVLMHYIGMQALNAGFHVTHSAGLVALSIVVGIGASGLALWLSFSKAAPDWLGASAAVLAIAISSMHYTAMAGTHVHAVADVAGQGAPSFTPGTLALVVSVVAFVVSGLFLLTLMPVGAKSVATVAAQEEVPIDPSAAFAASLPIERDGVRRTLDVEAIVAVQAQAHYTKLFDGSVCWFCPLSISDVEAKLDPSRFARVHRSHIVKLDRVTALRRAGDAGELALAAAVHYRVPVARAKTRWLRVRLAAPTARPAPHQIRQYG